MTDDSRAPRRFNSGVQNDQPRLAPIAAAPTLVTAAYESVRRSILSGVFAMGERLNEARIAEDLNISRGPVREALKRLSEEGLLIDQPRIGMTVRTFAAGDLADIYEVRAVIEPLAARLVVRRKADLSPLDDSLGELRAAAAAGDASGATIAEFGLHEELCRLSGNVHLYDAYHLLSGRVQLALSLDNASYKEMAESVVEHAQLVDVLRNADEDTAAEHVRQHILRLASGERLGAS